MPPLRLAVLALAFALTLTPTRAAEPAEPAGLPRSTPEAQGVSSEKLAEFISALDKNVTTMHSVMVVRHGHVIAEGWWKPQTPDTRHVMWSLSKSFTSTAVGLAIADKKLSLDDKVMKFFPDDLSAEPSANLKAMRVRDLLTMTAGHETEAKLSPNVNWAKTFLAQPVPHEPGTHFKYNTPATYMLSAIVQKVTGKTVLEYLTPRLFEPLGIEKPKWDSSPQGINIGGYGLFVRTEDVAKFGQLYLQKGKWDGKQLIPIDWVEAATSRQVPNGNNEKSDWNQGYGYQFWRSRHGAFRGDGAFGQFCVVLPEQDAVVVLTAQTGNMAAELNVVWDKLLPAFGPKPLAEDKAGHEKLLKLAGELAVRETPKGK